MGQPKDKAWESVQMPQIQQLRRPSFQENAVQAFFLRRGRKFVLTPGRPSHPGSLASVLSL